MANQLQLYVDTQIAEISPYKLKSNALLQDAELQDVTDAKSAREAAAIRKAITAHKKNVADARKDITRQFDDVKKQFMAAEKDALTPAEQAQKIIQDKLIQYEAEEERKRAEEEKRINEIIEPFNIDATTLETPAEADLQIELVEQAYQNLTDDDKANPAIKFAYAEAKTALLERHDEITLGSESDEAAAATAKADLEDAALERDLEAKAAETKQPKVGIKTVTRFEITDPSEVPRSLCEPSEKLIRAFIKTSDAEIPGVRIWQERSF